MFGNPAPILLGSSNESTNVSANCNTTKFATLKQRGVQIIGPNAGEQACGDVGFGRMAEPHQIFTALCEQFQEQSLAHLTVTITAGPTREALVPFDILVIIVQGKWVLRLLKPC